MCVSKQSGNVLFMILIAVVLFAALSYAVTNGTRTGASNAQTEKEQIERAVGHSCETQLNTALTRLRTFNGCTTEQISYELPDGSNSNPNAPSDKSCHIFHVNGAGASPCSMNETPVIWTNVVGAEVNGNSYTRTAVDDGWNESGASSTQVLPANTDGYAKYTVTANKKMFGLSETDTNAHYSSIDYAIYTQSGNILQVYEGYKRGDFGAWAAGDILEVSRTAGVISYKKNGVTFYTSSTLSNSSLIVDTAIYTEGAALSNALVSENFE